MVFTTPTDTITRHKYSLSLFSFPMNCQKEGKKGRGKGKREKEEEEEEESVTPPARLSFLEIHSFSKYSWSPQQFFPTISLDLSRIFLFSRDVYTSIGMKSCFLINFYFSISVPRFHFYLHIPPSYSRPQCLKTHNQRLYIRHFFR